MTLAFDLSILICSWNTVDDLRACLASLEAVRHEANFEVIVVDNNSGDGSPDMVEREFPNVVLFRMAQLILLQGVQASLAWGFKILTDPFHDIKLYWRAPIHLWRGELFDRQDQKSAARH